MNIKKAITPRVAKRIPEEVQFFIWYILKQNSKKQPLQNYLQSFLLIKGTKNGQPVQIIRYWPETPPAPIDYAFPTKRPVKESVYILVDDEKQTMITYQELEDDFK